MVIQSRLDGSRVTFRSPLERLTCSEDAIKRGGRIVECRPHETRNKFSVKVVMPSEDTEKEQTLTWVGHDAGLRMRKISVSETGPLLLLLPNLRPVYSYTNISSHLISMFSRTSAAVSRPLKTGNTVRPAKAVAAKSRKVETAASPVPNLEIPKSPEIADRSGFGMSGELRVGWEAGMSCMRSGQNEAAQVEFWPEVDMLTFSPQISPTDDFEKYAVPHIVYLRMLDGQVGVSDGSS